MHEYSGGCGDDLPSSFLGCSSFNIHGTHTFFLDELLTSDAAFADELELFDELEELEEFEDDDDDDECLDIMDWDREMSWMAELETEVETEVEIAREREFI